MQMFKPFVNFELNMQISFFFFFLQCKLKKKKKNILLHSVKLVLPQMCEVKNITN